MCVPSHLNLVRLFATLRTVARQVPLFMGFSREEQFSKLPRPPAEDLPDPGIEPMSPATPVLQADSLLLRHWGSLGNELSQDLKIFDELHTKTLLL